MSHTAGTTTGILYLIPIPVTDGALHTLSPEVGTHTAALRHYCVENTRTARRFLRSLHKDLVLEEINFSEIDKHDGPDLTLLRTWLKAGHDVGVMSESGCPGIADPGADIAAAAHALNATVVPLTGPSSLLLALMASGLNGQNFCFNGYIPVKEPDRSKRIKELETTSAKLRQTQMFIETPYRNNHLLADLLKTCLPKTRLCIAQHVTAPDASIKTRTIAEWLSDTPVISKVPVVFLLLA